MSGEPLVSNAPIRKAFEESEMTVSEVANRVYPGKKASTRVGRMLGVYDDNGRWQTEVTATKARQLLEAMDLDPVDVGL